MDSDRARWSNPLRAQLAVAELEKKLGTPLDETVADRTERLD